VANFDHKRLNFKKIYSLLLSSLILREKKKFSHSHRQ
jgi:hypothetical protein